MTGRVLLLRVRTDRPHAPTYQALLDELDHAAAAALAGAGWTPTVVAAAETAPEQILEAAREADVIVVLGGEDVHPDLYGGPTEYPGSGHHEPDADRVTIDVIRDAVDRKAPLLGICRGHQLLNVALGGTLIPHMEGHRGGPGAAYVPVALDFAGDAPAGLRDIVAAPLCTHHQALDRVAEGLRVRARAADGTVEAVEHLEAPVLGVQWHPEHPDVAAAELPPLVAYVANARVVR